MKKEDNEKQKSEYRIRDLSTGLYLSRGWSIAKGNFSPHWSEDGRVWRKIGDLKRILTMMKQKGLEISFLWIVESKCGEIEEKFSVLSLCNK